MNRIGTTSWSACSARSAWSWRCSRPRRALEPWRQSRCSLPPRAAMMPTMELPVISPEQREPWYASGLRFTCTQCGNCCTGPPGYVWISPAEISRLAESLQLTDAQIIERYCRKIGERYSLREKRGPGGNDCIFLTELDDAASSEGRSVTLKRRGCAIYTVRPLQCRTWPFWPENLADRSTWDRAAQRCHGMDQGRRRFSRRQIESIRDAKDWPDKPPTSAG